MMRVKEQQQQQNQMLRQPPMMSAHINQLRRNGMGVPPNLQKTVLQNNGL